MINIPRFCVTLLAVWRLSSPVRGQDYYYDTDGEPTTAAEGSGTTATADGTTATEFPDYPTTTDPATDAPAPAPSAGGGGGAGGGGTGGGGGGGSSDIIPSEILQLIPLILSLILPLIQQSQTPPPPSQIVFITPAPALTAPPPVTQPPRPEPDHHYHHHHPPYSILDPFALPPLAFYDYALFGPPLLPFRTNDHILQRLKKPSIDRQTSRVMKVKKKVRSHSKLIRKQKKKKINPLSPRPFNAIRTRSKPRKRLIKKRTNPVKSSQRKNRKKIQFRRQFNLPGKSSPVLVSSSDLARGVNFAFKGKSYKLTLQQMMKVLRRRYLLRKKKTKPKSELKTFQQKYLRKKVPPKISAPKARREKNKSSYFRFRVKL